MMVANVYGPCFTTDQVLFNELHTRFLEPSPSPVDQLYHPLLFTEEETETRENWAGTGRLENAGTGQPRWLSGLVPLSAQGVILETWDRVPGLAPCMEPASPSACVSASLSLFLCLS